MRRIVLWSSSIGLFRWLDPVVWIGWLLVLGVSVYWYLQGTQIPWQPVASFISGLFALSHYMLSKVTLFRGLFDRFNERYDGLNGDLSDIANNGSVVIQYGSPQAKSLADYFNLCAEEYFYYQRGLIPETVWHSWREGMKFYWRHEGIQKFWLKEVADSASFYGFDPKTELM